MLLDRFENRALRPTQNIIVMYLRTSLTIANLIMSYEYFYEFVGKFSANTFVAGHYVPC